MKTQLVFAIAFLPILAGCAFGFEIGIGTTIGSECSVSTSLSDCPPRDTLTGFADDYRVNVSESDSPSENLLDFEVFEYHTKRVWRANAKLWDEVMATQSLDQISCFPGIDDKHSLVVVKHHNQLCGHWRGYAYKLAVYELNFEKRSVRRVLGLSDGCGDSDLIYSEDERIKYTATNSFFDVEIRDGNVYFLLFERDKPDSVAKVRRFVLKDRNFVPVE